MIRKKPAGIWQKFLNYKKETQEKLDFYGGTVFSSIYMKISLGIIAAIIVINLSAFSMLNNYSEKYFENEYIDNFSSTLSSLNWSTSVLLENYDIPTLQRQIEDAGSYPDIDTIRVYSIDQTVIASNKQEEIGKKIPEPSVKEIIDKNKFRHIDSDFKKGKLNIAMPVKGAEYSRINNSDISGVFFLKSNVDNAMIELKNSKIYFLEKTVAMGVILLIFMIIILTKILFIPVSKINRAINSISGGKFDHNIDYNSKNEMGYLITEFNSMAYKLHQRDSLLQEHNQNLEKKVDERTKELKLTQDVTVNSLAYLAEMRDNETGNHILRTKRYVEALAGHLRDHPRFREALTTRNIELISKSAPLHDIGKVGISDAILLKPGRYTDEEFEIMKKHTVYGRNAIIKSEKKNGVNSFLKFAEEIAYCHHEKFDGSGYPRGISGEDIPLSARLMTISDIYDALISKRVYKKAFSHEEAVKIITEGDGRTSPEHFDPDILKAFTDIQDQFHKIYLELKED
ncbi:HD domain-containing phosphohydrolase [uncultured Ilyobacter sp.]|uniref:HD domain-containing phosphohydrolase n=1 Tax=uncultured Ilyobacter sp. TaxID=544433 RepID=UPI0029BFDDB5|nr:HD domain-containing phosphohydrolase [uncultured Ilyobacter sp.]